MYQCNPTPQNVHPAIEEHAPAGVKRSHEEAFPDSSTPTISRIASTALSPDHDHSSNMPLQNSTSTTKRARTINSDLQNPLTTIIPIEILVKEILPRCDSQSLVHLQLTCSQLHSIIKDETKLYKDLLIKLALKKVLEIDETKSPYQKIYALCAFAMIQAPLNPEHANELLQEAIHASADLYDSPPTRFSSQGSPCTEVIPHLIKSQTLALIADAQKFMDLEQAIGTANQIPNVEIKEQILAGIGLQQSLTDTSKALEIISDIDDLQLTEETLGDIAKQQTLTDIGKALTTTSLITDAEQQGKVLSYIAIQQALTDIGKALGIANTIQRADNPSIKRSYIETLYKIYELQALTDLPQALSNMQKKKAQARSKIKQKMEAQDDCLSAIAGKLYSTDSEGAMTAAAQIEDNDIKYNIMAFIIAKTDCEKALLTVDHIRDPYTKAIALCNVAKELASTNPMKAQECCEGAAKLAKSDLRLDELDYVLYHIAKTQALFNIGTAISTAYLIEKQPFRESTLSNIVNVHASKHFEDTLASPVCADLDQYHARENTIQPSKMPAQQFPSLFKAGVSAKPERSSTYFHQAVARADQIWSGPKLSRIIIELTKIFAETNPSNGNR